MQVAKKVSYFRALITGIQCGRSPRRVQNMVLAAHSIAGTLTSEIRVETGALWILPPHDLDDPEFSFSTCHSPMISDCHCLTAMTMYTWWYVMFSYWKYLSPIAWPFPDLFWSCIYSLFGGIALMPTTGSIKHPATIRGVDPESFPGCESCFAALPLPGIR